MLPPVVDGPSIGIDLGTTNCAVAVWDSTRGHPKWMRFANIATPPRNSSKIGRVVPSAVLFLTRDTAALHNLVDEAQDVDGILERSDLVALVGNSAVKILEESQAREIEMPFSPAQVSAAFVASVKRLIGAANSIAFRNSDFLDSLPYRVVSGGTEENNLYLEITPLGSSETVLVTPTQVSAVLLQSLRLSAGRYLRLCAAKKQLKVPGDAREPCCHAVVGVPAQYGRAQRSLIERACRIAGFTGRVLLLTESTAAAIAYGLTVGITIATTKTILVFDMGGGTTDITIAEMHPPALDAPTSVNADFEVKVTFGDQRLGGDDMDAALSRLVWQRLKVHPSDCSLHTQREVLLHGKQAKEALCGNAEHGDLQPVNSYSMTVHGRSICLTRKDFEAVIEPLIHRAKKLIQEAIRQYKATSCTSIMTNQTDAAITFDEVLLVGGATRVPAVRSLLKQLFPPPVPPELCLSLNAMAAVAQGTAIQAALWSGLIPRYDIESALMLDTVPHAIGVRLSEAHFIEVIKKGSPLPATGFAPFQLADARQAGVTVQAVEQVDIETYESIGDFTFLLHRMTKAQLANLGNDARLVDVGMKLNAQGEFVVSILDPHDPEHVKRRLNHEKIRAASADGSKAGHSVLNTYTATAEVCEGEALLTDQLVLCFVCILLFVVYVMVKLLVAEPISVLQP
jgi:molecular chaperone DnaK (HSP70)